ncbi:acyl carrier protein [Actinomadura gamaensis]|uniref:Acyl carrier protein n=1 Tax=Actinomadura gamaensis TaxID=1763541 RepID=A0ABV9TVW6_9ACTN
MADATRETVRRFVSAHLGGASVDDDEDLFAEGHVNSLFAVQVVMWVERTFDLTVARGDLDIANFRSVEAIADFVDRRNGAAEHSDFVDRRNGAAEQSEEAGAWTSR